MKNRDGRIDINLFHGLESRLKASEQQLEEKEHLLIEYVYKCYEMKDAVEALQTELAAKDLEIAELRAMLSTRTEA